MISVKRMGNEKYEVTVEMRVTTKHMVTIPHAYYDHLTGGKVTPELLAEKSFEFLLERESNTSILRSFELSVIGTYFPEYEKIITGRLRNE